MATQRRSSRAICAFLVLVLGSTSALQLVTDNPSTYASANPSDPKYVIALSKNAAPLPIGAAGRIMVDKTGRKYHCKSPTFDTPAPAVPEPTEAQEEAASIRTPAELLESMNSLCLYRQEGLWTYEMCYKKQARQFRQHAIPNPTRVGSHDAVAEDFSCGKYSPELNPSMEIKFDGSSASQPIKYVSHVLGGGQSCVMTGLPRTAEVRFTCMRDIRDNTIVSVKEFPTCNYVFTVATPFLCNHPEFKLPPEKLYTVVCDPEPLPPGASPAADKGGEQQGKQGKDTQASPEGGVAWKLGRMPEDGSGEHTGAGAGGRSPADQDTSAYPQRPQGHHDPDEEAAKQGWNGVHVASPAPAKQGVEDGEYEDVPVEDEFVEEGDEDDDEDSHDEL
mmetsp:Transcript_31818/g.70690  ORF Transcript_31818/g.70690 Transcript_31818/m.70690 type:complete len:390 (-) Transcript_31818:180-1349(-)|eukprot:CAMPEP_0202894030 /NCGR_PEP_ID=MMETSP1392-20130828/3490_1 /ASSEMBLY_ACC=CAM_ASM_000868 /TAXON_ID=225041 /ORGANISM="Chlamydomonas chlamydogama, Strain SAG 11-48b" /LENGTH=389 /DNA_ID=CAMNT_0049578567 /DNA_START=161 /DNA_END=1330 /DNA_ORIENTATION=-